MSDVVLVMAMDAPRKKGIENLSKRRKDIAGNDDAEQSPCLDNTITDVND